MLRTRLVAVVLVSLEQFLLAGNNNKCRVYDMYIETKIIYLQFTCSLQIEREKESIKKGITITIKITSYFELTTKKSYGSN